MKPINVPTLEDVAAAAGVSTSTVSRCLSIPDRVAPKTREKILNIVRELGYSPNFGAQALAAKRTNTFGAVFPTMNNAIFAAGLQAFQNELGRNGITLLLASSFYDQQTEEEQIRSLIAKGAEGLLLIGTRRSEEIYKFIEDRQIPLVLAWTYSKDSKRSCVGFDNFQATRQLAEKALALGHRSFAFISAERASNDRADERVTGVKAALESFSSETTHLNIIETSYSIENGAEGFRQAFDRDAKPSIVMCGNDVLAAGAYKAARELKLNIPDDVSITGFDDIELASVLEPHLTTIHVPHTEMGERAAKALLNKVNDPAFHENVELPTHRVEGNSLARPA